MKESNVWKLCLLALGRKFPGARVFRNNIGSGWIGAGFTMKAGQTYRAEGGERVIVHPRPIDFGLVKGSGDGIGWHSVEITQDMVGRRVAVFVSMETKSARGRATKDQMNWFNQVQAAGGIALIISDPNQIEL